MTQNSVLFDAPGPRARAISHVITALAIIAVVALLAWMVMVLAAPRTVGGVEVPGMFDRSRWDIFVIPEVWKNFIWTGVWNTLRAAAVAAVGAIALGIAFALMRSSKLWWVSRPIAVIQEFFRGMPVLLMMLFILLVAGIAPFWAVVVALILYNGTIIGEALRAGLVSLPRGQREAALSVGMGEFQSKMIVEFPQAFRQMLPIIVAQLVVLLKDTSLGYIVGYQELIRRMMTYLVATAGERYILSIFFVTLALYLAINLAMSWFARWVAAKSAAGQSAGKKRGLKLLPAEILARQGTDTQLIATQQDPTTKKP